MIWLVVKKPSPLKNDGVSSSIGIMTFPTEWKNKSHVPNHQPGWLEIWVFLYQNGWTVICWATRHQGSRGFAAFNLLHTKTRWNTGPLFNASFLISVALQKKTNKKNWRSDLIHFLRGLKYKPMDIHGDVWPGTWQMQIPYLGIESWTTQEKQGMAATDTLW